MLSDRFRYSIFEKRNHMIAPVPCSPKDLELKYYDYTIPQELIAQRPAIPRDSARLLVYYQREDRVEHDTILNIAKYLPESSLLVTNQSKVYSCRLLGKRQGGGKVECFMFDFDENANKGWGLIKSSHKKRLGEQLYFDGGIEAIIEDRDSDDHFKLSFNRTIREVMAKVGQVPIPPYIRKGYSDQRDKQDYQTLFAKELGSVAAPTAGLHFSFRVLKSLKGRNIERASITLHVGLGTFRPVQESIISSHKMHNEFFSISKDNWEKIKKAPFRTLVGTTSLRALESFGRLKNPSPDKFYKTDLFLYPGQPVQSLQAILTNFHLPKSSLIMLVSSLIGREKTLELYDLAIREEYRFFSYGDAMLILGGIV